MAASTGGQSIGTCRSYSRTASSSTPKSSSGVQLVLLISRAGRSGRGRTAPRLLQVVSGVACRRRAAPLPVALLLSMYWCIAEMVWPSQTIPASISAQRGLLTGIHAIGNASRVQVLAQPHSNEALLT